MNHPGGWFRDAIVVVTGAGSGIGQATALRFAEQGADVFALDVNRDKLRSTRDLLAANDQYAHTIQCDVADPSSIDKVMKRIVGMTGNPRILVNCAGEWPQDDLVNISPEVALRVVKINQLGPHWMAQAAWQHMASAGGGVIVNIGSIQSSATYVQPNLYSATKAALAGLTKAQAIQGRADNIRSVCISPGVVATNMANWEHMPPAFVNAWRTTIPAGRRGTALEIADIITFVCSPTAAYMNGTEIVVDGGLSAEHRLTSFIPPRTELNANDPDRQPL